MFLDFTGMAHKWLAWTASIQFLPALLAVNVLVLLFLVALTLLLGRVYCSVICPLGVMQDIIAWFGGMGKKRRMRYSYSPERRWLRRSVLVAFVVMFIKCRYSQRKKYLPLLLLSCSIGYAFIYVSGVKWMQMIGGDITAAQCLMFTGILECCIQCGLIQTNTGYSDLFEAGSIGAQIIDNNYHTLYASLNAPSLTTSMMKSADSGGGTLLDDNTLLKSSKISGGHVLWQEDIKDIRVILEKLEENKKTISESNYLDEENYKTKVKISAVREKNRLYDQLQVQTAHQIELLDKIMAQYERESEKTIRHSLLSKAAVIGAYIKRRGNLMFVLERADVTDTDELSACLEESFTNLELMGIECAVDIPFKCSIYTQDAIRIYDFFEKVIEEAIDDLHSVWMKARSLEDTNVFYLQVESNTDLSKLAYLADTCGVDEGVWHFSLHIRKAGE